jgi:hypothetical protein
MSKHLHICSWLGYLEDVSSFARAPGRPALQIVFHLLGIRLAGSRSRRAKRFSCEQHEEAGK